VQPSHPHGRLTAHEVSARPRRPHPAVRVRAGTPPAVRAEILAAMPARFLCSSALNIDLDPRPKVLSCTSRTVPLPALALVLSTHTNAAPIAVARRSLATDGVGRPLAQRLLEAGEHVVDVPAKLAARVRRSTCPRTSTLRISRFPDRPVKIPARHVIREPKGHCRGPARPTGFCRPSCRVMPPLPNAMVLVSTAIAYPHPLPDPQVCAPPVRPARWLGPELPTVFRAADEAGRRPFAFVQVTGLRPQNLMTAKTTSF
jgi:hypothetical protein